jgi:hypothetical protein
MTQTAINQLEQKKREGPDKIDQFCLRALFEDLFLRL